jgi:hypothetical protein
MMRPGRSLTAAALAVASIVTSVPGGSSAATVGPSVSSSGVLYSPRAVPIAVTAYALCETTCSARLFYRVPATADTKDLGSTGAVSWSNVAMTLGTVTQALIGTLNTFTGVIPESVVDVRGVDYLIRVDDHGYLAYWPGTPAAPGLAQPKGVRLGYWHTYVTNPTMGFHTVPAVTAAYRAAIPISAQATCAKSCSARLWFRRTGLLNPSMVDLDDPPTADGTSAADEQWTYVAMGVDSIDQRTEPYGAGIYQFSAQIPASYVDTRGVDYAIQVGDGVTRMFWPGTPYNGYYYAFDGLRVGWQHVYVQNPVIAAHVQSVFLSARSQPIRLTAQAICSTLKCTMTLQYNYGGGALTNIGMTFAVETPLSGGMRLQTYEVTIPASAVRTGTLAYRFLASDGHTGAYAPGTFNNGYYIKLTGTPVAQYVIVVT